MPFSKTIVGVLTLLLFSSFQSRGNEQSLFNTEKTIRVGLGTDSEGKPYYQLYYQNKMVLDTSYLGLTLEGLDLSKGLALSKIEPAKSITDTYTMHHGKQKTIHYSAQRYVVLFASEEGTILECHFDLSKNGVAFRYQIANSETADITVQHEGSSYGFPSSTKAWMQPMSKAKSGWSETNPSYEEHYRMEVPVNDRSPLGEGYVYPALFNTDNTWVLISETNLHRNYCGSRLKYDDDLQGLRVTFAQDKEVFPGGGLLPNGQQPFITPWRTIAVGSLKDIVENTLGTDLAAPAIDMDTDFIKSGLASWSWVLLKDSHINYETSLKFIDYASSMNWPYCLIDVNWDQKIGYEKMQELIAYAKTKNVKILLWYNSSGDWNSTTYSPKSKLVDAEGRRAEFARIKKMGAAGMKIDFFGGDGQSMIAYYHDILQDAAQQELMVNFHGATLPRGWHRTYPNLMTVEAIKGEEFITFDQKNADLQPSHCAVIPFTRNVYDPMDFTPMVLDSIPNITRRTTTAFELALPVLFTSGIQHIAEIPEGMEKMPNYVVDYLRFMPTQWDETRFIQGYPGKEVVLARRKGAKWYIVGINGEDKAKTLSFDISFVQHDEGIILFDHKTKDLTINGIKKVDTAPIDIDINPNGGFVIII